MGMVSIEYGDLGGGMNNGIHSERMHPREAPIVLNWYPYGTHLRRRGGFKKICDLTTVNSEAHGMMLLATPPVPVAPASTLYTDRGFDLIIAGQNSFARADGAVGVSIPLVYGEALLGTTSFLESHLPWTLLQYKGLGYALRKNIFGSFFRIERDRVIRAGISGAHTGTLALGAPGVGTFSAGSYYLAVVFRNSETGLTSAIVNIPTIAILGANESINITTLPVSPNPQVDTRDVYVTLPGTTAGDGYYLASTVSDNVTTTLTIADPPTATSARLEDDSFPPNARQYFPAPQDLFTGDIWRDRLWATDGVDVFFSKFFQPEAFNLEDTISVFPDDGYSITSIKAWDDRLIVGKTNAIYYITGNDLATFNVSVLSENIGSINSGCMKVVGNHLYWMGPDKAIYRSSGSGDPEKISDPWMTPLLDRIQDPELAFADVRTDKNWFVVCDPNGFGTEVNTAESIIESIPLPYTFLVFNYRENTWTTFSLNTNPTCFAQNYDEAETPMLVVSDGTSIWNFADETAGWDDIYPTSSLPYARQPVSCAVMFRSDDFGVPGRMKALKQVGLLFEYERFDNPTGAPDEVNIRVFGDLDFGAPLVERIRQMDNGGRFWRQYGIGLLKSKHTRFQLFVLLTSIDPQLTLREVRLDVGVARRLANRSL